MLRTPTALTILELLRVEEENDEHQLWPHVSIDQLYVNWPRDLPRPHIGEVQATLEALDKQTFYVKNLGHKTYQILPLGVDALKKVYVAVEKALALIEVNVEE